VEWNCQKTKLGSVHTCIDDPGEMRVEHDVLFASIPQPCSKLHYVIVTVSLLEGTVANHPHTWYCSFEVIVASCSRVFPDNVLLGARLNLSLTCLKLKLGVDTIL
jgi:hypothetical protein